MWYNYQNVESFSAFLFNQYCLLLYNGNLDDDDDVDVKTRVGGSILDLWELEMFLVWCHYQTLYIDNNILYSFLFYHG